LYIVAYFYYICQHNIFDISFDISCSSQSISLKFWYVIVGIED